MIKDDVNPPFKMPHAVQLHLLKVLCQFSHYVTLCAHFCKDKSLQGKVDGERAMIKVVFPILFVISWGTLNANLGNAADYGGQTMDNSVPHLSQTNLFAILRHLKDGRLSCPQWKSETRTWGRIMRQPAPFPFVLPLTS